MVEARGARHEARNVKLTIEYDGTSFSGWQRQSTRPSIQAELERAIYALTHERVNLIGAGRTDAGVHALAQVANFRTAGRVRTERLAAALNAHLPDAIRVLAAEDAAPEFHARYSATGRTYRYVILNRAAPSAILRHHAWHVTTPLDLPGMTRALDALRGRHRFTAFRGVGSGETSTVCDLRIAELRRADALVVFTFEADRFLRHMVRMMIGTVVRVGQGRVPPRDVEPILAAEDNHRAGPRAPARGLFLVRVGYER